MNKILKMASKLHLCIHENTTFTLNQYIFLGDAFVENIASVTKMSNKF